MLTYKSYGNSEKPVLCLLPGAGLGAWAYNQVIPLCCRQIQRLIFKPLFQLGLKGRL